VCLNHDSTIDMTDKDFFNIWNHSSGDEVSKSEIRDSYSKVVRR
jgi:hypothetical protein